MMTDRACSQSPVALSKKRSWEARVGSVSSCCSIWVGNFLASGASGDLAKALNHAILEGLDFTQRADTLVIHNSLSSFLRESKAHKGLAHSSHGVFLGVKSLWSLRLQQVACERV